MPLPIRDGNQSLTTLSTILVSNAHIPAHTVVSLGSQAITDIATAVSGVELGPNTLNALENITVTLGQVTITGGLTDAQLRASAVTIGGSVTATISGTPSVTFGTAVITGSASILNFPATQTVTFGTAVITGSTSIIGTPSVTFTQASVTFGQSTITGSISVLNFPASQSVTFGATTGSVSVLNFPASQAVTFTDASLTDTQLRASAVTVGGTVTVGNSLTISSLPAISGTVTVGNTVTIAGTVTANTNLNAPDFESLQNLTLVSNDGGSLSSGEVLWAGESTAISTSLTIPTSAVKGRAFLVVVENNGGGTFSIQGQFHGCGTQAGSFADSSNYFTVKGASRGFNTSAISVTNNGTPVSYLFCAGFSSASTGTGSRLLETLPFDLNFGIHFVSGSGSCTIKIYKVSLPNDLYLPSVIGGNLRTWLSSPVATVTVGNSVTISSLPAISGTVTIGTLPNGSLTTRFGSITTAEIAQITSAVTNANRKYLLAQNISSSAVTIGIGFSPTTTQGIQLNAGAGLTFDAFCPTGAVYWLGSVTGASFTILEG